MDRGWAASIARPVAPGEVGSALSPEAVADVPGEFGHGGGRRGLALQRDGEDRQVRQPGRGGKHGEVLALMSAAGAPLQLAGAA